MAYYGLVIKKISFDQLLDLFKDSEQLAIMANSDKALVTLFVAALGMSVTVVVLLFLWLCILVVTRIIGSIESSEKKKKNKKIVNNKTTNNKTSKISTNTQDILEEDETLIAAIVAAAVASKMNTSVHNIVIKNIVELEEHTLNWSKVGRIEQMNARY